MPLPILMIQRRIPQQDHASHRSLVARSCPKQQVKTDDHMAKVKEQLMHEQKSIEAAEERRKQREQKQYAKQVQAEKEKERNASKKRQIDEISKLRKQRVKAVRGWSWRLLTQLVCCLFGLP